MKKYTISIICIFGICCQSAVSQNNTLSDQYYTFRQKVTKEYNDFRDECNKAYATFLCKAWAEYQLLPSLPIPKEEKVPPVVFPEEPIVDEEPVTEDEPIIEVIPLVKPEPQPLPVAPIKEEPQPVELYFTFVYCGTECRVRLDDRHRFSLPDCSENTVADAWKQCSEAIYNNVIRDCLELRIRHSLCDWAYLQMLQEMAAAFFPGERDKATLLAAYLYCQSGYKMRLAQNGGRLYLLVASRHMIFEHAYIEIDGEMFYPLGCKEGGRFYVCRASFPKEQSLSLWMNQAPVLGVAKTDSRVLQSKRYPELKAEVYTNKNLLAYFDSYPSSVVGGNKMTRWAMYAQTPISEEVKGSLYPVLKAKLQGLSEADAADRLLNFVQTAFEYEYDDVVWGGDRALFAEESLYYPYCDCEDRSILYSHLVRDLLGLEVALVYYPGHLATAVCFNEEVQGDYLSIDNHRFIICDPTYINAPIGANMPGLECDKIEVIVLE